MNQLIYIINYKKDDPTLDFLHKPRTISALFCMLSIGFYIALYSDTKEPLEHDVKWFFFFFFPFFL